MAIWWVIIVYDWQCCHQKLLHCCIWEISSDIKYVSLSVRNRSFVVNHNLWCSSAECYWLSHCTLILPVFFYFCFISCFLSSNFVPPSQTIDFGLNLVSCRSKWISSSIFMCISVHFLMHTPNMHTHTHNKVYVWSVMLLHLIPFHPISVRYLIEFDWIQTTERNLNEITNTNTHESERGRNMKWKIKIEKKSQAAFNLRENEK